ncbi:MAG: N-acetyl sugar amidotransferase [Armatimonadetes bacterium]|nr:N-acetyl sugar amidotransferase [Armatimonadota bacterium]
MIKLEQQTAAEIQNTNSGYRMCTRCIMDTSDPEIVFDVEGVCNHCHQYEHQRKTVMVDPKDRKRLLEDLVKSIQEEGQGKEYDCLIGVSGGVDSTYVAYLTRELGLKPLAVHMDNGWNSELAVTNIKKTLDHLGIDLYTEVLDWEEFRDLQLAFLKASTPDSEIPTDHIITATLMAIAKKYRIRTILMGSNVSSEGILPRMWSQGIRDWRYIKSVHDLFGTQPMKSLPHANLTSFILSRTVWKQRWVNILDMIDYDKARAMDTIQRDLEWVYYGGKHYESVYTRFFQAYILPQKFGYDKRRAHLSTLVLSGTITREQALEEIKEPTCEPELLRHDRAFVIKKFGINEAEFERIMNLPKKTIYDYPAYENAWFLHVFRTIYRLPRLLRARRA